ncbi:hypothetical protein M406DRAFT_253795 [Cryphonectria parasitica EP155]|uniref:Tetratricopeptide repeat protein 1 n=1 Tax=Cryphonectria parasitica (strain ATCC 38755 / EP155) TaxID=660469 RepID=A0A9P4Y555_CRYP1|nr:uncharacterized protein M406DRAFT_253795 [Cryphonectria parasitica EP155]KAF3766888.1 hypothetical protein M406DRAFT_253795 [Cryphonectria parasitica EP155]
MSDKTATAPSSDSPPISKNPGDPSQPVETSPKATSQDDDTPDEPEVVRFSPEEEKELLTESQSHKSEANVLFNAGSYTQALARYSDATSVCPNYLDFEVAVLQSNISACHLKLEEWKDAIGSATKALEKLDKVDHQLAEEEEEEEEEVEEEIVSSGAANSAPARARGEEEDDDPATVSRLKRREDSRRIRYKALMRRARARSEAGGWSNLAGAEEDYKLLSKMDNVTAGDRKIVAAQLRSLPPRVKAAQQQETAEMWGKLKELGNGILKPFGLSTDNFKMEQDPKTGGYSMNFKQG